VHAAVASRRVGAQVDPVELFDDVLDLVRDQLHLVVVDRDLHEGSQLRARRGEPCSRPNAGWQPARLHDSHGEVRRGRDPRALPPEHARSLEHRLHDGSEGGRDDQVGGPGDVLRERACRIVLACCRPR
jgi:hypothetical protein